ncbi:ABC transporter, ATP-binding protein [Lactiplantibacillus plantarum]|nr:ABC transporter, ATP-binding protein [Lactiplantibacillus plantarum]MCG0599546.1 ABC transporter, ATP-binding protein [Lactiplantibacillus plantarum]
MMRVEHLAYQFSRNGQPFFKDVSFQLKSPGVNFLIGLNCQIKCNTKNLFLEVV